MSFDDVLTAMAKPPGDGGLRRGSLATRFEPRQHVWGKDLLHFTLLKPTFVPHASFQGPVAIVRMAPRASRLRRPPHLLPGPPRQ